MTNTNHRVSYAIKWIETWCAQGDKPVRLTREERQLLKQVYGGDGPGDIVLEGRLAAFVCLLHLCSREAKAGSPAPALRTDPWSIWRATGREQRKYLERDGSVIRCRELGTSYSAAAA